MSKLIIGLVLALIGFLAGFIPQYGQANEAKAKLAERDRQLADETVARTMGDFRNSAALLAAELAKSNYAESGERASKLFTEMREYSARAPEGMRPLLEGALADRDALIAAIAKADPSAQQLSQALFLRLQKP